MKLFTSLFLILWGLNLSASSPDSLSFGICDSLPASVYETQNLQFLAIENGLGYCTSPFKKLDARISKLTELRTLYFNSRYHDSVTVLPPEVASLQKLEELHTDQVTPEIFKLRNLKVLELSPSSSEELDILKEYSFASFPLLEKLTIHFYPLPEEDFELKGLNSLKQLHSVQLTGGPQKAAQQALDNPAIEHVSFHSMKSVADLDFSRSQGLKTVGLVRNMAKVLAPSLFSLKNLEVLNISNNELSEIPREIGKLKNLRVLSAGNNPITGIPKELGNCKKLIQLSLSGSGLESLPTSIGNLSELQKLNISRTALTVIPESFSRLSKLTYLDLSNNKLKQLPSKWQNFSALKILDLSNNELTYLPESMGMLKSLERMNLGYNQITNFPQSVGQMTMLKILDIPRNKIPALPHDIGSLQQLQTLSAYQNEIKEIPSSLFDLKNLEVLHLSANQITELSPDIQKLTKLDQLEIQGNKLNIPNELFSLPVLERMWVDSKQGLDKAFAEKNSDVYIIYTN